ncbi:MAG: nuclear transport factor 2 family protein [Phototrophicaceae bacterium]
MIKRVLSVGAQCIAPLQIMILVLVLAACSTGANTADAPAEAVERYLTAKVSADRDGVAALLCSELESQLMREASAFVSLSEAQLVDMTCTTNDGNASVTCTGQISAKYGAEVTTFDLASYRVVQEDGEWKWCGEATP